MKKISGAVLVALGTLVGVPGVILCFTIIGLPLGLPLVFAGAGLVILGLHLLGRDTDVITRRLRRPRRRLRSAA